MGVGYILRLWIFNLWELKGKEITNYNDGNWHRWDGPQGKMPEGVHHKSVIEQVWHDEYSKKSGITRDTAGTRAWDQTLKFRVVKEYKEPREFWLCEGCVFADEDAAYGYRADAYYYRGDCDEIIHVKEVTQ